MFKLLGSITQIETENHKYKPPTYNIDLGIIPFHTYKLIIDGYVRYLTKQEMVLRVYDKINEIKAYIEDMNTRLSALNQQQIINIYNNTTSDRLNYELISQYSNNTLYTNKGYSIIEYTKSITDEITVEINNILSDLNKHNNNHYSLFNGEYTEIDNFINNLTLENDAIKYEN